MPTWDLSWGVIWPMVQVILEPFGPVIAVLSAILVAGTTVGIFLKWFRG